jgi:hypothetical protein
MIAEADYAVNYIRFFQNLGFRQFNSNLKTGTKTDCKSGSRAL